MENIPQHIYFHYILFYSTTQTVTWPVTSADQGRRQPQQWCIISIAHDNPHVLGITLFGGALNTYNYYRGAASRNSPSRQMFRLCFNGRENISSLLANLREIMNRAVTERYALLYSQEICAIFGQGIALIGTSRRAVFVIDLVTMLRERYSEESLTRPGLDTSLVILNQRANITGHIVTLREDLHRASTAVVLLHSKEGYAMPEPGMPSGISFNRRIDGFGTLGVLREIANMVSVWPTLQYNARIYAILGQDLASIASLERRVNIADRLGVEIANAASRVSALFHCQKSYSIAGQDLFGSSSAPLVTRQCYFASLSSNNSHSLDIAVRETFCQNNLDRKTSESKMALIEKGPINPLDIQSQLNDQNKDSFKKVAPFEDGLAGNRGGMERIVAKRSASVPQDFDNAALLCGCIEHERVAIKNVYEYGQSKNNKPENAQEYATGHANGDENCDLKGHVKTVANGYLDSHLEDEDYSWLCDREAQNNSKWDNESEHDGMYDSDSETDSMYQSDNESDLDQAEEDYFMELLQGDGQDHPVNQPHYDLMPHWLPGYILHAHAAMNPQVDQPDHGPPEEAPAGANPHHPPLHGAQDQPLVVNEDDDAQNELPANGADMNANGEDHDEDPPNGPEMPAMAQPVLPQGGQHPQQGNQPQQQAQATGPLKRLRAAARYVRRKLTRHRSPVPMYVPGAPREERTPVGLEEAPALVGMPMIPQEDGDDIDEEVQPRGLFACFASLFRRHGNPVQEYALQAEQVQEFEEQIPLVEPEMDLLEEDMPVIDEPVEGAEPQIEAIALAIEAF